MSGIRKRNAITLMLGALSAVVFGGLYGLIAGNAPATQTASSAEVVTAPRSAPQVVAIAVDDDEDDKSGEEDDDESEDETAVATTPEPTVAATPAPTTATTTTTTTHTRTRGS